MDKECQWIIGLRYSESINGMTNVHCKEKVTHTHSHPVTYVLQAQPNMPGVIPFSLCDEHSSLYLESKNSHDGGR